MERCFSVEAKSFCLSMKEGCPDLHLEEKRKVILPNHTMRAIKLRWCMGELRRQEVFWKWLSMLREVVNELFGYLRAVVGGDGVNLQMSCGGCWFHRLLCTLFQGHSLR
jgi:hypothetical protein